MPGRFKNNELFKYTRMSKYDSELWNLFINQHGKEYETFDYDLAVGEGSPVDESVPFWLAKDWSDLTKKRIDAVGYVGSTAHLFEVKTIAGTSALGQLLSYNLLFKISFPELTIRSLNVICSTILPEEILIYKRNGINIFQYSLA
jgi:hypothetical protein